MEKESWFVILICVLLTIVISVTIIFIFNNQRVNEVNNVNVKDEIGDLFKDESPDLNYYSKLEVDRLISNSCYTKPEVDAMIRNISK